MIKDLFSHKIHSSGDEWPDKLIGLAFLFAEFDGKPYDRDAIVDRLSTISPRTLDVPRDQSKFRDEYGAYQAYFGLYYLELEGGQWRVRLTEATKRFLVQEEPDAAAFLRVQLSLFQYPSGMGAAYSQPGKLRIQANVRDRALELIQGKVHLSPLRLIVRLLVADAERNGYSIFDAAVSYSEIFAAANSPSINTDIAPDTAKLSDVLGRVRSRKLLPPDNFERRFHLLKHLEMFDLRYRDKIKFLNPPHPEDRLLLERRVAAILSIEEQFDGFDTATDERDLEAVIRSGDWGRYFDGVQTLSSQVVAELASDAPSRFVSPTTPSVSRYPAAAPTTYPIKARDFGAPSASSAARKRPPVDPEITRIKRQRRNLQHKILVDRMDAALRQIEAVPKENAHIDLLADIPSDGSFIFEMKSGGENLLDQIRKGVSQLYEYRFRYRHELRPDVRLCLVLPYDPVEVPWLHEYLCVDRDLCVCWFNADGSIGSPEYCAEYLAPLNAPAPAS